MGVRMDSQIETPSQNKMEAGYLRVLYLKLIFCGWLGLGLSLGLLERQILAAELALASNARIVFLGDSITQAGDEPGGYVDIIRRSFAENKTDLNATVIGAGIGGHRVPDLEARLDRDALSQKPTHVVIYIGINDVWHFHLDGHQGTPKDEYERGLNRLIDRVQAVGCQAVLCTPSVVGEKTDGSNNLDSMLDEYAAISRQVAKSQDVPLIDLRSAFLNHLKKKNPNQAEKGILTSDGVHLNADGNRFVAAQLLSAFGVEFAPDRLLRHVVLFQWKDGTTPDKVKQIEQMFAALPERIPEIQSFEWGTDVSLENLSQGFTHCFLVSFLSKSDRDAYLPHEAHRRFMDIAKPHIKNVLVIDYWTEI